MKKLRLVEIIFDNEIRAEEINAFRGAVIKKVGRDSILYHNHIEETFRFSYPLIQYKRINGYAAILSLGEGIEELPKLFTNPDLKITLNGREMELKIKKLRLNQYNLNVYDTYFYYRILNWIGLNEKNYRQYLEIEEATERIKLLERILVANILSFAKGIDWFIEEGKKVEVKILKIEKERMKKYKNLSKLMFDFEIKTNVFLPPHIGLGKAPSVGYGVVYKKEKQMQIVDNENNNF